MIRALICGVSVLDGSYPANLLLAKGYRVWGAARDVPVARFDSPMALGIRDAVTPLSMVQTDLRSVLNSRMRSDPEMYIFVGSKFGRVVFRATSYTMIRGTGSNAGLRGTREYVDLNV